MGSVVFEELGVVCLGPIVRHLERSGGIPPVEFHRRSSGALWRIRPVVVAPSGGYIMH